MKYFYLNTFNEKDEYKSSIQIYSKSPSDDPMDDKGIYGFSRIDFPEIPEIKYLLLDKNADLLDIINAPMLTFTGLLMNNRTQKIFMSYMLPSHKYYPAYIKDYKANIFEYVWLQTSSERNYDNFMDYKKSQFYWKKDYGNIEREDIEINSLQDLEDFKIKLKKGQGIRVKIVVLKTDFLNLNIDLFKIARLSNDWIISERLKIALEENEITGISFKEVGNLIVDS